MADRLDKWADVAAGVKHDPEWDARPQARPRREILVHLNVTVVGGDTRSADEIADSIVKTARFGGVGYVVVALAEEV